MKYTAQISISEDIQNVKKLFASEEKEFSNSRAKYEIIEEKNHLIFKLEANDSTALRAVLNSVAKVLSVYEKTKKALGR